MRTTRALIAVAAALMADPRGRHYGYPLSKATGLRSGAMYPLLKRLLDEGWVTDGWEPSDIPGRPPRRYYTLTEAGMVGLGALADRATRAAAAQTTPRLQGGIA